MKEEMKVSEEEDGGMWWTIVGVSENEIGSNG